MSQANVIEEKLVRPGDQTVWRLGPLPPGRHRYAFSIDEREITIENPVFSSPSDL